MADKTRVGHCKKDDCDVYIGRGPGARDMLQTPVGERGWLGNPYTLEQHSRAVSISRFRRDFKARLEDSVHFRRAVARLCGATLGCWCQRVHEDKPDCHGEVIAEWADKLADYQEVSSLAFD